MSDDAPALPPPPGVQPDFDHPYSLASFAIPVFTVCMVISALTTSLRFFAQYRLHKAWFWADLCILISVACHFAFNSVLLDALRSGLGRHMWDVRASAFPSIQFSLYVSYLIYDPAITLAKVSILVQFKHIFAGTGHNRFWYAAIFLIAINVLFYVPETFAIMFSCTPREKIWDPSVEGFCLDISGLLTASGPFNVVSDFLIFLLPMYAIWHLHIPVKKRIEVSCAFGVGLFGCICSAVRIAYSAQLDRTGDGTYVITQNQMWANAEITVGIIIANSIIVPKLIRSFRPSSDRPSAGSESLDSTLRNKTSWRNKALATPRTLVDDLELDTPFPAGEDFGKLERQRTEDMVTMDEERHRVAPWFDTNPTDR